MKKLSLLVVVGLAASANAQLLYTNGFVDAAAGGRVIYNMDVNSGVSSVFGVVNDPGLSWINALEVVGNDLYLTDGGELYKMNMTTKVTTLVGAMGASLQGGLAWDASTSTMWATSNGSNVYTVDINTGAAVLQGSITGSTFSGLAFNKNDGRVYSADDGTLDDINSFDPNNLAAGVTKLVDFPLVDSDIDALAYDGGDKFYLVNDSNSTSPGVAQNGVYVYSISTGTYSYLNTVFTGTAAGGYSAAAYIPAPGALALLGLGGLVATRRRR